MEIRPIRLNKIRLKILLIVTLCYMFVLAFISFVKRPCPACSGNMEANLLPTFCDQCVVELD